MADPQIVSCPGCGKRYSVPAGAAPGQFQCQDCSAVVVYGRGAEPAQGKRTGAKAARSHAKAAAAKRKLARSRRDEEEDDGEGRPGRGSRSGREKQNSAVYVMALVGIVVIIGGAALLYSQSQKKEPVRTGAAPKAPAEWTPTPGPEAAAAAPAPPPKPLPPPDPPPEAPKPTGGLTASLRGGMHEKADDFKAAANPPTGSHYGKNQAALLLMLRDRRAEAWVDPGHLPDTPPDLAQKIDQDIQKMADVNGGSEFLKAQDRLIKVGRPAIPKVVGLLSRLDFSKYSTVLEGRDACSLGDAIDNVLRGITGMPHDKIPVLQYSPMDGKISTYVDALDAWCLWWFTVGYKRETFYGKAGAAEEEKL